MNSKKVSTKLEENNINYQFKLLYAIGIVMIVANHTSGNGGISLFYELFPAASFEIGLFVFTSGYFYKEKYEENILKYFIKKIKNTYFTALCLEFCLCSNYTNIACRRFYDRWKY